MDCEDSSREAGVCCFLVALPVFRESGEPRDSATQKQLPGLGLRLRAKGEPRISHAFGLKMRMSQNASMATSADAGMVRIHAHTMRRAIPQRTAEIRCVVPTPMIAPVMVCVVLTGIPASAVPKRVMAPAASAQNPPTGLSLVIFEPMV